MANKLWEKDFQINAEIERFTVGRDREMDLYLAKYDVLGSMAHITMLNSIGLIADDELPLMAGDTVLTVEPSLETVLAARDAVERVRPRANDEIILFETGSQNIKRINTNHYEKVYDCRAVHAYRDSR